MGITNYYPVLFTVGYQSCAVNIFPIYCPAFTYSMKAAILAAVPDHISGIDRQSVHAARLVPNSKEDWIVVRDAHPPLIGRRLFEQIRKRLESHPKSIEQRQRVSKLDTHGKTWNGQRSRFILSGLVKCSLCGNRYQGVTRNKGKRRLDGSRVKTYYYGCGGYITKGKKVCEMNPIPKKILEEKVIEVVLDFYKGYLDKGGRKKLAEAVKLQVNCEGKELVTARQRTQTEQEKIGKTIDNLLDNLTATNREYVDQRLNELKQQKQQLETRLEELDQLYLSQAEIDGIVTDSMQFLSGIEFTLHHGLPHEKLAALRQCIKKIWVNKPAGEIKLSIRLVSAGNLQATQELKISV